MKRKSEYKPLLFTTTIRNPKRMRGLLSIFKDFKGISLTDELAEKIMGELIRYGLYRPMKKTRDVKNKWKDTKSGEFSNILLSDKEVKEMLDCNPQKHKEAGFEKGWSSRFATIFDIAKELGFVYFWINEKIEFSEIGLKLAESIEVETAADNCILVNDLHPEIEQQAFLNAFAKSQRNNPFVRVLNENVPLILLLEVIQKLNADKECNEAGISKLELPLVIFWKDNNADNMYRLIKRIRQEHGYNPSWEVIIDICVKEIMGGNFKKFEPKSIMNEYPDEFIRKMRLTGLISIRGGGRFIDINKNEQEKVDYVLNIYSSYQKFETERDYFNYMAETDKNLISFVSKPIEIADNNKYLEKWTNIYEFDKIKQELSILSKTGISNDDILKYLSSPIRLEFLTALAIKSKFPNVQVIPHYPCDDEGLPTSTAGGNQGDIECFENTDGILIEVTMSEGRTQTIMEIWPIARHLEEFSKKSNRSICYFVAPSIYTDSKKQIEYVRDTDKLLIYPKTIIEFVNYLETIENLYCQELE